MIENALQFVILALATARLTLLIVRDSITEQPRNWIFLRFPPENDERQGWYFQNWHKVDGEWKYFTDDARANAPWRIKRKPAFIGEALSCPDCFGVWMAGLIFGLYLAFPTVTLYGSSVLALAMVNSLIARKYH